MPTVNGDAADRDERLYIALGTFYEAARRGEAPDRRQFLARHPDLADELERFFDDQDRFHRAAEPLREAGGAPTLPDGDFGDYEILGEIARGGMGVVYQARQRSLGRTVALKVMLVGRHASPDDLARFRNEAEAVAHLDHPNIVPIYEVGEHDGTSFFAMRLVEGPSLASRLDEFAADPRSAARLVAEVARAVHHAHQRGVLHRDLKPSNILLDAEGRPHITDFGLAKRVEGDSDLTLSGAILGSPPYMAAEQATGHRGSITTATDVYGLGAVLYATLTGRPPFQADSALETIEQVRTRDPEPPSALNPRVDRDLQTICLKCLDKDPSRRYASALDLADDLDRWLRGEPIAARPVGRAGRAWRWCRRNPVVAALSALLVVLALGSIASLALSRAAIDVQRGRAEANFVKSRAAVDQMLSEVGRKTLADVPQMEPIRRALLEKALAFYEGFLDERGSDPSIRLETGRAYRRVGDIRKILGEPEHADQAYLRSIALLEALASDRPRDPGPRAELAAALSMRAGLLQSDSRRAEAETCYRRAVDLGERLAADFPDASAHRSDLASTLSSLAASVMLPTGRLDEAEAALRTAIGLEEGLVSGQPDAPLRSQIGGKLHNLALIFMQRGRHDEACSLFERAIAHQRAAVEADRRNPQFRRFLRNHYEMLGVSLRMHGQVDASLRAFSEVVALGEGLASEFPFRPEYREELAGSYGNLGMTQLGAGLIQEAERSTRRSLELFEALAADRPRVAAYPKGLAMTYGNLDLVLSGSGRPADAERSRLRALEIWEELMTAEPAIADHHQGRNGCLGNLRHNMATERQLHDPSRAVALVRRATEQTPDDKAAWIVLGWALYRSGENEGAIAALDRAMDLRSGGGASDWFVMAMARHRRGDRDQARAWFDKAVAWCEANRTKAKEWRLLRDEASALLGVAETKQAAATSGR